MIKKRYYIFLATIIGVLCGGMFANAQDWNSFQGLDKVKGLIVQNVSSLEDRKTLRLISREMYALEAALQGPCQGSKIIHMDIGLQGTISERRETVERFMRFFVAHNPTLIELRLSGIGLYQKEVIPLLAQLPTLRRLNLSRSTPSCMAPPYIPELYVYGADLIIQHLPHLKELIVGCSQVDQDTMKALKALPHLICVQIGNCDAHKPIPVAWELNDLLRVRRPDGFPTPF